MEEWGFKYTTKIVWVKGQMKVQVIDDDDDNEVYIHPFVKLKKGMGGLFRGAHEDLLIGRYKRMPKNKGVRAIPDVIISPATRHSAKPPETIGLIEEMSPGPYYEMFARDLAQGWQGFGLELEEEGDDE
jgi:N6-adenosine-specific RNA methylase IME4